MILIITMPFPLYHLIISSSSSSSHLRDRKRVQAMKRDAARQRKHYRVTEVEACKLARGLVSTLLLRGVTAVVTREKRALFRQAISFSGEYCVVSLRRSASVRRKQVDRLCEGCQTHSIVCKYEHADRSTSSQRAPCICVAVTPFEAWEMRIYNPLTTETVRLRLSMDDVRSTLASYVLAERMRTVEHVNKALGDQPFDSLAPLFKARSSSSSSRIHCSSSSSSDQGRAPRLRDSVAAAYLRAMSESSVLPRIPSRFQSDLQRMVYEKGTHRHFQHLLDREGYATLMEAGTNSLTIDNYDGPVMRSAAAAATTPRWDWQPLADLSRLKLLIERAVILSEELRLTKEDRRSESESLQGEVRRLSMEVEQREMVYEDAYSRVVMSCLAIEHATKRIAEVMCFSKQLFESFLLQEEQQQQDTRQSYESFEDGEGWRGLNDKRKLQKAHLLLMEALEKALLSLASSRQQLQALQEASRQANRNYFEAQRKHASHAPVMLLAQKVMVEMKQHTSEAMQALLATYSMPRKYPIVPLGGTGGGTGGGGSSVASSIIPESGLPSTQRFSNARRMQRVPWGLVFVRDPLERLRMEYRRGMAVLQRRVLNLRPAYGTMMMAVCL